MNRPRVYVDTCVIIRFLHPRAGPARQKTAAFFRDLEQDAYLGILSDFCRLEYCGYLKDAIAKERLGKVSKSDVDLGLDRFDRLVEEYGIEEVSADALLGVPFVSDCMGIIEKSSPIMKRGRWVAIKGADSVHAVLASRCDADFLATLDTGFRGLCDSVRPMVLWDKY